MKQITGQLIVRYAGGANCPDAERIAGKGRQLVMVFGILAVPIESKFKDEHQYPVTGDASNVVRICEEQGVDVSATSIGDSPSGLLRQPIWRV